MTSPEGSLWTPSVNDKFGPAVDDVRAAIKAMGGTGPLSDAEITEIREKHGLDANEMVGVLIVGQNFGREPIEVHEWHEKDERLRREESESQYETRRQSEMDSELQRIIDEASA